MASHIDRRRFIASASAVSTLPLLANRTTAYGTLSANSLEDTESPPIAVFAKHVQHMDFEELGKRLSQIGVNGIEATLRPGGQIEPENMPAQLGGLCAALAKHDQRVIIAASNVNSVNAASEAYVKQLAKHEIPYFRMDYYRYDFNRPMLPQLDEFAMQATRLSQLCKSVGVTALYQNHAGDKYVGAAVWDLAEVLSEVDQDAMAVALDIRHTTLELTQSYKAAYRRIRPLMGATYVKDFDWVDGKPTNVPLGTGRSKPLFDLIQKDGFVGPLSLHMEYTDHRDESKLEESWTAISNDVAQLHKWLKKS